MNKNEGSIDRGIRIVVGLVLLALVFVGPQSMWGWLGLVPLTTGLVGFCPLYKVLGLSTCATRKPPMGAA
jgi:membrane protein implicated in regulation of membrane protease activity